MKQFFIAVLCVLNPVTSSCPEGILTSLPFALEYAVWRGWHQTLIYTPDLESSCRWAMIRFGKCLSLNGVAALFTDPSKNHHVKEKVGVMIILPKLNNNATDSLMQYFKQLHEEKSMNTASYDWLLAARSDQDFRTVRNILNVTAIRFDQNIVVSYPNQPIRALRLCDHNFVYQKAKVGFGTFQRNCSNRSSIACKNEHERSYFKSSQRFKNLVKNSTYRLNDRVTPLLASGLLEYNFSKMFRMINMTDLTTKWHTLDSWVRTNYGLRRTEGVKLIQYFKVRVNSTLYGHFLGSWTRKESMSRVECPYPVESRTFLGEALNIGRCNSSDDGTSQLEDDGPSAPVLLDDILFFLAARLNATPFIRYYPKLGFRSYEGAWTGLLGALVDTTVDLALEPVTAHQPRHDDMDFVFPIAETMCNIYIRHQETSTVRDIFLAPFSWRLLVCVLAVAIVSAAAVAIISRFTPYMITDRAMEYSEALLWSTGILCQQGGTWTPPSPSARTLLIVCLMFAVITYNSYAAFITSVLSVRVASVDTVAAVLHSTTFQIGYIRNGADQMYLMSTKDAQLNAFYIRGYSNAENLVSSAEEGLMRAAQHDYAFFAGQRAARSTLSLLSQARGRCSLRELPVPSTRAHLAFPMPRRSPYARPTLVSLLQLRSGGSLARLGATLVPPMPRCEPPTGFASARAADVRSALVLISLGLIAAVLLGVGEYCWKNKKDITKLGKRWCRRLLGNFK